MIDHRFLSKQVRRFTFVLTALAPFLRWLRNASEPRDHIQSSVGQRYPDTSALGKRLQRVGVYGSAPSSFMMPNDFTNDEGKKLFGKLRIKLSGRSKVTETGSLLRLPVGVGRRQVVLGLQNSNLLGAPEALRQHVNDGGVYIVDTVPYVLKLGHGAGRTDISQLLIRLFDL